ncbi:MAG: serine hydrolase, partial [Holophagae bacterium]
MEHEVAMLERLNRAVGWLAFTGLLWPMVAVTVEATESPGRASRAVAQALFRVSSPADQGIDPERLAEAYDLASEIPHIYSLLVIRNRALVAEEYFSWPRQTTARPVASVTKSIVGALVGIALEEGHLSSLDQPMIGFFPEFDGPDLDPQKREITIRHLVEMRAGYPFDSTDEFFDRISQTTNWLR